ncbi:MAG: hypothetical protein R3F29_03755 [Planctomycetota bacterium]
MISKPLATRVVKLSRQFAALELWRDIGDSQPFALELPGEAHLTYGVLLGAEGITFGLALYSGERALEQLRNVSRGDDEHRVARMVMLSFDAPGNLRPELLELARTAGCNERVVPMVLVVDGEQPARAPRNADLRFVLTALEAVLLADEGGLLQPRPVDLERGGSMLCLPVAIEHNGRVCNVGQRWIEVPAAEREENDADELPWPLDELPLQDGEWVVGVDRMAAMIADEDRLMQRLLVVDPERDYVVALKALSPADDAALALAAAIDDAPRDSPWREHLPRRVTFTHRGLFEALGPLLEARGVEVSRSDGHPLLDSIRSELDAHLQSVAAATSDEAEPELPPAAAAVERLRDSVGERIGDALDKVDAYSRKAKELFFGDPDLLDSFEDDADRDDWGDETDDFHEIATEAQRMAIIADAAYRQWYAACYRSKRGRRTVAESLLAGSLPPDERRLLEAIVAARPGLFRIVEVQAPVVVLADTLSDFQVELVAPRLAVGLDPTLLLAGRIVAYPDAPFFEIWAPPLPASELQLVLAVFSARFGELTHERLIAQPELLGRLWLLFDELRREGEGGAEHEPRTGPGLRLVEREDETDA